MGENHSLLEALLQEEVDLQFSEFTNNTAYEVGTRIIEKAFKENKSIVVDIQKDGEQVFYVRMTGGTASNDDWVRRKNNTVHYFNHSSYYMHEHLKSINENVETHSLDPKDYAAEGGAFPLIVKNSGIVGTITVSGLTGDQDHEMVTCVLSDFLNG